MRNLLQTATAANDNPLRTAPSGEASEQGDRSSQIAGPAWMAAAPIGELYVDKHTIATDDNSLGQVPYPEQFAAIIKAVQSGEQIEGIVEIPDIVTRNPVRRLTSLYSFQF